MARGVRRRSLPPSKRGRRRIVLSGPSVLPRLSVSGPRNRRQPARQNRNRDARPPWISSPPPPDSWRSLRRATYPPLRRAPPPPANHAATASRCPMSLKSPYKRGFSSPPTGEAAGRYRRKGRARFLSDEENPRSPTRSSIASSTTLTASTSRASPSESATSRRRSTAATTSEGARPGGRVHGRLRRRRRPNRRGARRHAEWRSLPPRPQPLYSTNRARLRSHRAGLRPAPNVAKEVETPAPVPGETARQRDPPPSSVAGFAVKCRQNLRQVRQNKHTGPGRVPEALRRV